MLVCAGAQRWQPPEVAPCGFSVYAGNAQRVGGTFSICWCVGAAQQSGVVWSVGTRGSCNAAVPALIAVRPAAR